MKQLRTGDAAVTRAARTATAVAATSPDWARPWWLDRQLRPTHAAFVAEGETGVIENLTGRSWTVLATTSSGPLALVDPAGAVQPIGANWSLDWAIGAEDRWHRPAVESTVRQRLVSHAPVVETACKVPSGDAVARSYAVTTSDGDALVCEIENESPVPFVAVFSIRPSLSLGIGSISSIRLEHPYVLVDDRPVVVLDGRVARWSFRDAPDDAWLEVIAGRAAAGDPLEVRSASGLATASFLVPVPHRASVRAVIYPNAPRRARPSAPIAVASAGQVARGWESHTNRAARIELPDRRVTDAYLAAVRGLLAATSGPFPIPVGRETAWSVADEASIACTLASVGLVDASAHVVRRRGDEHELDSWFRREHASVERNVAVFEAIGAHWWASRDPRVMDGILGAVVKSAHWTERARSRSSEHRPAAEARRAAHSLRSIAPALRAVGQPEAADDLEAFAARFLLDVDDTSSASTHSPAADDAREPAVMSRRGADVVATARAARAELVAGDPFGFERLAWLLRVASPTTRWPTNIDPTLGTGCAGSGDDPLAAAVFVDLVRTTVVDDTGVPNALVLLPVVPASWFGQSIDVHDLPTRVGRVSFAVRWHGARPAILWEITPHDPAHPPMVTAPGLDPSWSTDAPSGEALLATPAASVPLVEQPRSDHVPMTTLEPRVRRAAADAETTVIPSAVDAPMVEPGDSFA